MQLGEIRLKDPAGVAFIEMQIIHEAEERQKYDKELANKMKSRAHRRH